jgi:predicted ester cyclase
MARSEMELIDSNLALVRPVSMSVDEGLTDDRARHLVSVAQLLYTFWNTGDEQYLRQAVTDSFVDHTLPLDRPQGPDGMVAASAGFREAVPDLRCELSDLLVVGDKLAARLHFRGTFTGTYNGIRGKGQTIDFLGFDIQHVGAEKIFEDWHLEDNLALLLQAGLATIALA